MTTFNYIGTFKKKGIDLYLINICKNTDKVKKIINDSLAIKKYPKKLFNDKNDFQKYLYFDNYEFLFLNLKEKCTNKNLFNLFGNVGRSLSNSNKNILVYLYSEDESIIENQIIGFILGYYDSSIFKTDKTNKKNKIYFYHNKKKFRNIIEHSIIKADLQNEIRTIVNTPANIMNSSMLRKNIVNNIDKKVKIKTLNEKELNKKGLNLILSVNNGSNNPAMLLILEYKNINKNVKPIVLIGKGVMFDSGGYNLKTGDFSDMKNDMTGSAIVYGVMDLLAKSNVKGHFIGLLPLVENMVDSKATRPGDIVTAYNKKTVEIIDTDAEGRLIMADALAYSKNYKPSLCIDIATLTGDAAYSFGGKSSVIMGNNNRLINSLIKYGDNNNERIWELPMWSEYLDQVDSEIADYRNYSKGAQAGAIMAGAFLSKFVPKNTSWIHLDIAGVDLNEGDSKRSFGSTGEVFRTLYDFSKNYFN